eukprot:1116602-Rhodomonas_salina.1
MTVTCAFLRWARYQWQQRALTQRMHGSRHKVRFAESMKRWEFEEAPLANLVNLQVLVYPSPRARA